MEIKRKQIIVSLIFVVSIFALFELAAQIFVISEKEIEVAKNFIEKSEKIKNEFGVIKKIDYVRAGSKVSYRGKSSSKHAIKIFQYNYNISGGKKSGTVKVILTFDDKGEIISYEIRKTAQYTQDVVIENKKIGAG